MKPCSCWHPLLLLLCFMLAGCMPSRALPQFRAYDFAFAKVQDTGDLLLDHVAAAEKQEGQRVFRRRNTDIAFGVDLFQPENAAYFAGTIDPPLTAAYRRSLAVIVGYNATLLAIAEGRSLDELKTTASRLNNELGGLLTLAGVTSSLTPLQPALKLLGVAVNEALVAASRAAFEEAMLKNFQTVDDMLALMAGNGAIELEAKLTGFKRQTLINSATGLKSLSPDEEARLRAEIHAADAALYDWVAMIEDARKSMALVRLAINAPPSFEAQASDLADAAAAIRVRAAAVRAQLLQSN